jgi:hypothetical protein
VNLEGAYPKKFVFHPRPMHFTCHTLTTDFRQSVMCLRLSLRMGLATLRANACRIPYAPDRMGTWRTYCCGT